MKFDVGILARQPVPEIVRQVQLAEALGFDTAWITDTHLICRDLWVTLTACALGTSRIRLGPGVTVPHTRHISVKASAILSLAEIAGNRVVIGVGTGGSAAQTIGLTLAQVSRVGTLDAMATALRRLVNGGTTRFESGTEGRIAWLDRPRPVPIYVAGSGPRMLTAAGRLGDGAIIYASRRDGRTHLWAITPGDPAPVQLTFGEWDDRDPAVSPDGTRVAFASSRGGGWDLYVLERSPDGCGVILNIEP